LGDQISKPPSRAVVLQSVDPDSKDPLDNEPAPAQLVTIVAALFSANGMNRPYKAITTTNNVRNVLFEKALLTSPRYRLRIA
jgi:hypothetical protein